MNGSARIKALLRKSADPSRVAVLQSFFKTGPGQYAGELLRSTGPPFGTSFDPSRVVSRPVGTATLDVTTGNALTWHYRIGATTGSKPITRFLFTPPAGTLCQ